jgi:murein DD-endopeptidase MepM/ murein hydrolase activator NlpD
LANLSATFKIFKKNRISIISALVLVAALCCIFAFAGNNEEIIDSEAIFSEGASSEAESLEANGYNGIGLYIDGNLVAAVKDKATAQSAVNEVLSIKANAIGVSAADEVYFANSIEMVAGDYPDEAFADEEAVTAYLGKKTSNYVSNFVVDYNGQILPVRLSVCSVSVFTENVTLEYKTKTVYTDAIRDGAKKVLSKGYNGEAQETYRVVSVDGVVSGRETVSFDVSVAPSDEIIYIGTRSNGKSVVSMGTFQKPYDGIITSYVGPRWGRTHNGIDIVAEGRGCKGDPVYAAADGVVVRADRYGGYGNCVIIDHGDGIQTLYAHFSKITVSVGDVVKAGDQVGNIGSTGNSTGPHLHFEVRVDGEFVNPLIFVDYE